MSSIIEDLKGLCAKSAEFKRVARELLEREEREKERLRDVAAREHLDTLLSGARHFAMREGFTTYDIELDFDGGGIPCRLMNAESATPPIEEIDAISSKIVTLLEGHGFLDVKCKALKPKGGYKRHFTFSLPPD